MPAHASYSRTCYSASADRDGDGYAVPGTKSVKFSVDGVRCPSGYVNRANDCNDSDKNVHPRRHEVASNSVDDDCDGHTDEPEPVFQSDIYPTTFQDAFSMKVHFNSSTELIYYYFDRLYVRVDFHDLYTDEWSSTAVQKVTSIDSSSSTSIWVSPSGGLYPGSVYTAQAHFLDENDNELTASDYYHVMTDPDIEDSLRRARYYIVNKGLFEWSKSAYGDSGYRGTQVDGTRYGASKDVTWCSEFYSSMTLPYLWRMGQRSTTASIGSFYQLYDAWWPGSADGGAPGDYLGLDTDGDGKKNHSAMILSHAPGGTDWTLEGNFEDEVRIWRRAIGPGNQVVGMGKILVGMLN
ncbi:MAG: putative metal-binding motif-containing protein [Vicinamibacterales bacterium]